MKPQTICPQLQPTCAGYFDDKFDVGSTMGGVVGVGDMLSDEEPSPPPKAKKPAGNAAAPFPTLEGSETVAQFVAKYKKACLSRRSAYNEVLEKWDAQKPVSGKKLD